MKHKKSDWGQKWELDFILRLEMSPDQNWDSSKTSERWILVGIERDTEENSENCN